MKLETIGNGKVNKTSNIFSILHATFEEIIITLLSKIHKSSEQSYCPLYKKQEKVFSRLKRIHKGGISQVCSDL